MQPHCSSSDDWRVWFLAGLRTGIKTIPGSRALWGLCDPRRRFERRLRRRHPGQLFQFANCTGMNRYPEVFSFVRDRLSEIARPHLLSFGCSTGEEVFTLRSYFPTAQIVGIDINPRNIAVCRERLRQVGDPYIRFDVAASPSREGSACFDAIFCMAVLRRGELGSIDAARCDPIICFSDFDRLVAGLSRCLKPGGMLAIIHSNFRFSDASTNSEYDTVFVVEPQGEPSPTPLFGKDNRRLPPIPYNDAVFQKRQNPG